MKYSTILKFVFAKLRLTKFYGGNRARVAEVDAVGYKTLPLKLFAPR